MGSGMAAMEGIDGCWSGWRRREEGWEAGEGCAAGKEGEERFGVPRFM
jgi:hypothetical protein